MLQTSPSVERAQPVLKWAGGKGRLLAQYQAHFPAQFNRYFEPFVGSGAVFFHLQNLQPGLSGRARLSDTNDELINLYRVLQSRVDALLEKLAFHSRNNSPEYFYKIRAEKPRTPVTRAARTIYLNRTCYNGLYRVNSKGGFNVPYGRYTNPRIVATERLLAAAAALQGVQLDVAPFQEVEKLARKGDLVYFDPPYQPLSATSSFTAYTRDSFGVPQQEQLAELFARLARKKVHVMLSNSDTPLVRELYAGFRLIEVRAPRFINSKADRREAIGELLVLGP